MESRSPRDRLTNIALRDGLSKGEDKLLAACSFTKEPGGLYDLDSLAMPPPLTPSSSNHLQAVRVKPLTEMMAEQPVETANLLANGSPELDISIKSDYSAEP